VEKTAHSTLQDAYVLHRRSFRETSLFIDIFTRDHGLLRLIAKGAHRGKNPKAVMLQPFRQLSLAWAGRSQLPTLTECELIGGHNLPGRAMLCGLYLNELLVRLLPPWDAHPRLFARYVEALQNLLGEERIESTLRVFELFVLNELGYVPALDEDADSGQPLDPDAHYDYVPEHGLVRGSLHPGSFRGASLLALTRGQLQNQDELREAKRLMRGIINPILGNRPLKSRELFHYTQIE
jgi:DNA repair protein RecO (recombination protein O)